VLAPARPRFINAFLAALSGVLRRTSNTTVPAEVLPMLNWKDGRALRYGNRDRTPGKANPAGFKAVRIANV
jgi:hypothetical protein